MPNRNYSSARRAASAAATRADIMASAERLFVERGYSSTGMPDIAADAGVSVATIYASIGSKSRLLIGMLEQAAHDEAIEEAMRRVEAATRARQLLVALAHGTRLVAERHEWLLGAVYDNAAADAEIASRQAEYLAVYRRNLDRAAERLGELGALSTDAVTAGGVLWFYFSFGPWRMLRESKWDWDRAENWLTTQAERAVLKPSRRRSVAGTTVAGPGQVLGATDVHPGETVVRRAGRP